MKSILYRSGMQILQFFWYLKGGRKITVFGKSIHVSPYTIFPNHRRLKLPKGGCTSEIVRYTDFVQMHATCNYVSQLQAQPVIIDIGAHHGAYAIVIGKLVERWGGKVIAIEPNPLSWAVLVENIRLNGLENIVTCEQIAISDKSGYMNVELLDSESRLSSVQSHRSCTVKVMTLEEVLKKYAINHVDLMIIDVEGAELPVLRSFPWQSVGIQRIFCELHPYAWRSFYYTGEDMKQFLSEHNYRCFDMYLREHKTFTDEAYLGPTLFVSSNLTETATKGDGGPSL